MGLRRIAAVAVCIALVDCSLFVDTSGLNGGADSGVSSDATSDGVFDSSNNGGESGAGDSGATACPSGPGPDMVRVPGNGSIASFCIDSTEVTSAAYGAFVASGAPLSLLPPECSFKSEFRAISTTGDIPANVDWCDAVGFCNYAGKRLCGKIGGGPNDFLAYADPSESQWYYACSGGGATAYPYGNAFDGTLCNGAAFDAGGAVAVKTASKCIGGFPGIWDMSGNMWEWEDSCTPGDSGSPADDQCRARGGTWVDVEDVLRCDYDYLRHFDPRRGDTSYMGFRCCAD